MFSASWSPWHQFKISLSYGSQTTVNTNLQKGSQIQNENHTSLHLNVVKHIGRMKQAEVFFCCKIEEPTKSCCLIFLNHTIPSFLASPPGCVRVTIITSHIDRRGGRPGKVGPANHTPFLSRQWGQILVWHRAKIRLRLNQGSKLRYQDDQDQVRNSSMAWTMTYITPPYL